MVETARRRLGPVDILINNAAVAFFGPTMDLPASRWTGVVARARSTRTFLLIDARAPRRCSSAAGGGSSTSPRSRRSGPGAGPYLGDEIVGDTAYGAQKAAHRALHPGARGGGLPGRGRCRRDRAVADRPDAGRARERPDHRRRRPARGGPGVHARGRPAARLATRSSDMAGRVVYSQQLLVEKGLLDRRRRPGRRPGAARVGLRPMIAAELAAALGEAPRELEPLSGGAGRCEMWSVDVVAGSRSCYRRYPEGFERDVVRDREWRVLGLARDAGVPVPEPVALTPAGIVVERVAGEARPRRLLSDDGLGSSRARCSSRAWRRPRRACTRSRRPRSCRARVGAGRRRGGRAGAAPGRDRGRDARALPRPPRRVAPAIELGLRWLRRTLPAPAPPSIVHGDFRLSNLVVAEDGGSHADRLGARARRATAPRISAGCACGRGASASPAPGARMRLARGAAGGLRRRRRAAP